MDQQNRATRPGGDRHAGTPAQEHPQPRQGNVRDYPAERARGARIVLDTPARRFVFFGGLILFVVFAIVMAIAARLAGPA